MIWLLLSILTALVFLLVKSSGDHEARIAALEAELQRRSDA